MGRMQRLTRLPLLVATMAMAIGTFAFTHHAAADISALQLGTRSCGSVTAYVQYDAFSEGDPPFYTVFAVDLNDNGVFGEANEPVAYILVGPGGTAGTVSAQLNFRAVPEGSVIAVTAYEVDSEGTLISPQLTPVSYVCAHRPDTAIASSTPKVSLPIVAVTAKVTAYSVQIYDGPSAYDNLIGGLPTSAIVNVLGRNSRGDWLEIQSGDTTGWIMWVTNAILFGPYQQLPIVG